MNASEKTKKDRSLWWELTVVVVIKATLIFCLWKVFFSSPVAEHMVVPEPLIEQRFGSVQHTDNP